MTFLIHSYVFFGSSSYTITTLVYVNDIIGPAKTIPKWSKPQCPLTELGGRHSKQFSSITNDCDMIRWSRVVPGSIILDPKKSIKLNCWLNHGPGVLMLSGRILSVELREGVNDGQSEQLFPCLASLALFHLITIMWMSYAAVPCGCPGNWTVVIVRVCNWSKWDQLRSGSLDVQALRQPAVAAFLSSDNLQSL